MPPVVLLKTPVDIAALDTTLEVSSNSSLSEQSAIQQYVKIQQAIQESIQREAQTFRAAQAAAKEQSAAAQAPIAPLIERWKEDQERAQSLAASFQPLIDSRWTEARERLQTLRAPLKAIHERVREAFQLFQPFQHEVLQGQKKLQEFAAPFQAYFQDLKARLQPFYDRMASKAYQKRAQRMSDINKMVSAYCPISLPYTFFLLNDDMKLNRNWQFLI
jgi:DNA repair exonuclease SbcCD ATPase subunit